MTEAPKGERRQAEGELMSMALFPLFEYQHRVVQTRLAMTKYGMDVLLVTDPANMNYLTGYDGWSFYVHQMVVLFADEPEPIWVGRKQDANGAKLTTWLSESNIRPYPEDYVQSEFHHPMDFVVNLLREHGQRTMVAGVEKDAYYFTAACMERLQAGLSNTKFVDATLLVNKIRLLKSDTEIQCMRNAGRLVERAMNRAIESIAEGVRECDVAAEVYHAQISGTDDFGGDYPAIVPLMLRGKKTSCSHLTWTDDIYQSGDTVILELAGCYQRYHSPLARTLVVGPPPKELVNLADVVVEGVNRALDTVKSGVTCHEVEQAWRSVIEPRGYTKESRLGYAVGLNYPPDWGEHTASLRRGDMTVLLPNMTFHMIAGMWMDDYGLEISETFRVTEAGCEVFANVPRQLFIKQVPPSLSLA